MLLMFQADFYLFENYHFNNLGRFILQKNCIKLLMQMHVSLIILNLE